MSIELSSVVPLEICHEDEHFVAVHKPAGQFVHRTALDGTAGLACLQQLRDQLGIRVYPCHRLDRPTSGVVLFAKSELALKHVSRAFAEGEVRKTYRALVRGWVTASGTVDYPIRAERDERAHEPKEAQTDYSPLESFALEIPFGGHDSVRFCHVELLPRTGRRHQLRRHMAHIRHPILGDTRHGDGKLNGFVREHLGFGRLMLVATCLSFNHPFGGQSVDIACPPARDFSMALAHLRKASV